ncbi:hypothetical protein, partial [Enterocloster sp.]|uniref:hypothetical protein n=1 Tax=Enterocloster sp. TaxID=2719315 RepID=UPI003A944C18
VNKRKSKEKGNVCYFFLNYFRNCLPCGQTSYTIKGYTKGHKQAVRAFYIEDSSIYRCSIDH